MCLIRKGGGKCDCRIEDTFIFLLDSCRDHVFIEGFAVIFDVLVSLWLCKAACDHV